MRTARLEPSGLSAQSQSREKSGRIEIKQTPAIQSVLQTIPDQKYPCAKDSGNNLLRTYAVAI